MVKLLYRDCYVAITACMFRNSLGVLFPGNYRIVDDWHFLVHVAHRTQIWGLPNVFVTMRRGYNHPHLWKDRISRISELRQYFRNIYLYYKDDPESPIDFTLYRKSMAYWLAEESKLLPNWIAYSNALQAVLYDPLARPAWQSLWEASGRAFKKATRKATRFATRLTQ